MYMTMTYDMYMYVNMYIHIQDTRIQDTSSPRFQVYILVRVCMEQILDKQVVMETIQQQKHVPFDSATGRNFDDGGAN